MAFFSVADELLRYLISRSIIVIWSTFKIFESFPFLGLLSILFMALFFQRMRETLFGFNFVLILLQRKPNAKVDRKRRNQKQNRK